MTDTLYVLLVACLAGCAVVTVCISALVVLPC